MSIFDKNLAVENNEAVLNMENTASFLEISTATVRNWVKCGHLRILGNNEKYFFYKKDIEDIKFKIINGDLEKLNKRANKGKADRIFAPDEYLQDKAGFNELNIAINFIKNNNIDLSVALLFISLNLLKKEKVLIKADIQHIIKKKDLSFTNKQIKEEIKSWLLEIDEKKIKEIFSFLLDCDIPQQQDILGFLYQSLLLEGKKSQNGSYYTPEIIVNGIIRDYLKKDSKVIDPCCGTGQFLLSFADIIDNPKNIYGVDIDDLAVRIARLNILIKYKNQDFIPNIICKNTLFDFGNNDLFSLNNDKKIKDFDVIATNPPWGAHFSREDIEKLKNFYPVIASLESFSYFIKKSLDLLRGNGIISFVLPESILNVKTHKDIREIILKNYQIKKIIYLDKIFKNVFTAVIRMDIQKNKKNINENNILINKNKKTYFIKQSDFLYNDDYVFNIDANNLDREVLQKIYNKRSICLDGNAEWGLGIVTGDNKKHFVFDKKLDNEEVVRGKDIEKFKINKSNVYLKFEPKKFQQVAPEQKYREKEKIVYRFISKRLVFAIDNKQRLTLNSANFFIPIFKGIPNKVIVALFNSSLYQFYFQKKFNSIKVLRSHIGNMVLPIFTEKENNKIINFVDKIARGENYFEKLDDYIMNRFGLSLEEKKYINEFNK